MLIHRVISGGQTGVDQAALRAAKAEGIPTGGWVPKGWRTEDGPAPWLADYGLRELDSADYDRRTHAVVSDATGCLWFGNPHSPGGICTAKACVKYNIDWFVVIVDSTPQDVADWIIGHLVEGETDPVVLMVAGNRESKSPGIGVRVEKFLRQVFELMVAPDEVK